MINHKYLTHLHVEGTFNSELSKNLLLYLSPWLNNPKAISERMRIPGLGIKGPVSCHLLLCATWPFTNLFSSPKCSLHLKVR